MTMPSVATKMTGNTAKCSFCNRQFPLDRTSCPHCACPQLFPNVSLSERDDERQKLHDRYEEARNECRRRGCEDTLVSFEEACGKSVAIFNCPTLKLFREMASGTDIFETYHDLESLRIRSERPIDHDWQKLRPQAEIELLGSHKHLDKLHYATLSLDGCGLNGYGDCTVTLREEMISHRSSVFEGNSALIYEKDHDFAGYLRSPWAERGKLCAAKIAGNLHGSMSCSEFPGMLLRNGKTQDEDEFVEVHVFGTMTAQTFQRVSTECSQHSHEEKTLWKAAKEKLAKNGVTVLEK